MSLTLKLGTLFIRTLAKPIANTIKKNAREHEKFRRICVSFAQGLHRIDIRLRLGLLQDPAIIERQIAREVAEAEAKRKKALPQSTVPTVKTQAETQAADAELAEIKKQAKEDVAKKNTPRVRPLSESKAIETGANFISETFMFMVAGSIILFESWRSRRKEASRREDVSDRLDRLEKEKEDLREKVEILNGLLEEKAGQEQTDKGSSPSEKQTIPIATVEMDEKSASVVAQASASNTGVNEKETPGK